MQTPIEAKRAKLAKLDVEFGQTPSGVVRSQYYAARRKVALLEADLAAARAKMESLSRHFGDSLVTNPQDEALYLQLHALSLELPV